MRAWRKIYAKTLESSDIAQLSDGAIVLFIYLIIAQDDSGYYPWNETSIRRVTVTRPEWAIEDADSFAQEIVQSGLSVFQDGGIVLVNGEQLNGIPRKDVDAEYYPRTHGETPVPRIGVRKQHIPDSLRWFVFQRDSFTCKVCGRKTDLTVDHIIPEIAQGTLEPSNLQTLCRSCNSQKGWRDYVTPSQRDVSPNQSQPQHHVALEQSREDKSRAEKERLSEPSASDVQAQKEKRPSETAGAKIVATETLPNTCQEWQDLIRVADSQQAQVKLLVDMVTHHFQHPPPRSGDHAIALLKQTRDPPYAVKLLWDAMGANPAGNVFNYAARIFSRRNGNSHKVDPRRAHEQGASTGRPWTVVGADDSPNAAL